jgi:hypothetical protein
MSKVSLSCHELLSVFIASVLFFVYRCDYLTSRQIPPPHSWSQPLTQTTAAKQSLARPKAAALASDGATDRKDLWTIIQEEMAAGGALGASGGGGGAEAKDDTTVVFAGAWRSGKSTLIQSFINKDKGMCTSIFLILHSMSGNNFQWDARNLCRVFHVNNFFFFFFFAFQRTFPCRPLVSTIK